MIYKKSDFPKKESSKGKRYLIGFNVTREQNDAIKDNARSIGVTVTQILMRACEDAGLFNSKGFPRKGRATHAK